MVEIGLFADMVQYIIDHADPDDYEYTQIMSRVQNKVNTLVRHDLYTQYKTCATSEERAAAREKYLDAIGLRGALKWQASSDLNVTHRSDDC